MKYLPLNNETYQCLRAAGYRWLLMRGVKTIGASADGLADVAYIMRPLLQGEEQQYPGAWMEPVDSGEVLAMLSYTGNLPNYLELSDD